MTWYFISLRQLNLQEMTKLALSNDAFSGNFSIFNCHLRPWMARPGGYCVTLVDPIPLLPSGPGGVFRVQLRSPPGLLKRGRPRTSWRLPWIARAVKLVPRLKRREWDSNPRWSHPHTRFPSVLLKPLGHLSGGEHFSASRFRLYHRSLLRTMLIGRITPSSRIVRRSATSFSLSIWQKRAGYSASLAI